MLLSLSPSLFKCQEIANSSPEPFFSSVFPKPSFSVIHPEPASSPVYLELAFSFNLLELFLFSFPVFPESSSFTCPKSFSSFILLLGDCFSLPPSPPPQLPNESSQMLDF